MTENLPSVCNALGSTPSKKTIKHHTHTQQNQIVIILAFGRQYGKYQASLGYRNQENQDKLRRQVEGNTEIF